MFEKMNVISGSPGAGGEYPIQTGFGWSNGVILDILMLVPDLAPSSSSFLAIINGLMPFFIHANPIKWFQKLLLNKHIML